MRSRQAPAGRSALLILAFSLGVAACDRRADTPPRSHAPGPDDVLVDGVRLRIRAAGGVRVERRDGARVNGHRVRCEGGELWIGDVNYGSISDGDVVDVRPDGLRVGGGLRGALPR